MRVLFSLSSLQVCVVEIKSPVRSDMSDVQVDISGVSLPLSSG